MSGAEARLAVATKSREEQGGATGEWGEKIERVWEFLSEAGGLDLDLDIEQEESDVVMGEVVGHVPQIKDEASVA